MERRRRRTRIPLLVIHSSYSYARILLLSLCFVLSNSENSYSQISPQSAALDDADFLQRPIIASTTPLLQSSFDDHSAIESGASSSVKHRIERSARPILNESPSQYAFENKLNYGEQEKTPSNIFNNAPPAAGRHYNLINPTNTVDHGTSHNVDFSEQEVLRSGKGLNENPFLEKGDPRPNSSGSPKIIVTPTMGIAMNTRPLSLRGMRQNPNPDIQDIITGIVKLLNGNVNVHANTSPSRRPIHTRINNRGPPRISDVQFTPEPPPPAPLPTARPPPPYPFDRPESPTRPFITDQMTPPNKNKPGFISQSRFPWQRPHPRPPIGTLTRQPIPTFNHQPPPQPQLPPNPDQNPFGHSGIEEHINSLKEPSDTYEVSESINEVADGGALPSTTTEESHVGDIPEGESSSDQELENEKPDSATIIAIQPSTNTDYTTSSTAVNTPTLDTFTTTTAATVESSPIAESKKSTVSTTATKAQPVPSRYVPRPGIVLDDPEFKPGQKIRPNYQQRPTSAAHPPPQAPPLPSNPRPPGYGEIFDITLSAIQGPTGGGSGVQTINIKPYGADKYNDEIIVSPTGTEGFVSIDGKRTYINLFGEQTDAPALPAASAIRPSATVHRDTQQQQTRAPASPHYGVVEKEPLSPNQITGSVSNVPHKPLYRPRAPPQPSAGQQQQPPPRIDTCILGDDSTCDKAQNEQCRVEFGVSSCHCRPSYARRNDRDPCRRIVSISMSLRVDKIFERKLSWDGKLAQPSSEPYLQLSFEAARAVSSAMDMTPFSDDFMEARVNRIYKGDESRGEAGIFVNVTLKLSENGETTRPAVKNDIQKHLLGVIHRRNNNIGNSALYVDSPTGAVSHLQDVDECSVADLNDCHAEATCTNLWGSFACECQQGYRDPWYDQPHRAGRECQTCPDTHCNNRGTCIYSEEGKETCSCTGNYYGAQCEIDGEVLGVAIGASVAAVIIIVLTLICLVMWSRRWQREQKQLVSPVFGYMNTVQQMKAQQASAPYTISLEDRMRWAQIADVMAQQGNHYAAEPVPGTMRPGSAMYNYPNLQALSQMGTLSMAGTLPMHGTGMGPVPMPRLASSTKSNGMRTLENSSSSEEEDRIDLLGRKFQVPRPKSRSNASIANQSGIYYDVDYEPSAGDMFDTANGQAASGQIPGPHGIPMSTYTSGRAPSSYYMK